MITKVTSEQGEYDKLKSRRDEWKKIADNTTVKQIHRDKAREGYERTVREISRKFRKVK